MPLRDPSSLSPSRRATARAVRPTRAVERARAFGMSTAEDISVLCGAVVGGTRCSHGRLRDACEICVATASCPRGRVPTECVAWGGGGVCVHGRQRSQCVRCGGKGICVHKKIRSRCAECGGSGVCEHGRRRYRCRICIEAKARHLRMTEGAFNIRAHFLGEDGSALATAEDFERQDEPGPKEAPDDAAFFSGGDAETRGTLTRRETPDGEDRANGDAASGVSFDDEPPRRGGSSSFTPNTDRTPAERTERGSAVPESGMGVSREASRRLARLRRRRGAKKSAACFLAS